MFLQRQICPRGDFDVPLMTGVATVGFSPVCTFSIALINKIPYMFLLEHILLQAAYKQVISYKDAHLTTNLVIKILTNLTANLFMYVYILAFGWSDIHKYFHCLLANTRMIL